MTEEQRQFLKEYAQNSFGSSNMTRAIFEIINEKMTEGKEEATPKNFPKSYFFPNTQTQKSMLEEQKPKKTKKKFQISLTAYDYFSLVKLAEKTDSSLQHYTISLIRNHLYKRHELLGNEIEFLRKSNYELHKIGVNVNQIAKALNMGEQAHLPINQLHKQIIDHIQIVEKVLRDNLNRY